jgi:hypothetical protein
MRIGLVLAACAKACGLARTPKSAPSNALAVASRRNERKFVEYDIEKAPKNTKCEMHTHQRDEPNEIDRT